MTLKLIGFKLKGGLSEDKQIYGKLIQSILPKRV